MSTTLEEAIEHVEKIYKENRSGWLYALKRGETKYAERCKKSMDTLEQIVKWLKELQAWRKAYDDCVNTDYESIDDSVRRLTIIGQVVNVRNVFADIRRTDDND